MQIGVNFCLNFVTRGLWRRKSPSGVQGEALVEGLRDEPPEADGLFIIKNCICDVKMQIGVNFCLNFKFCHTAILGREVSQWSPGVKPQYRVWRTSPQKWAVFL